MLNKLAVTGISSMQDGAYPSHSADGCMSAFLTFISNKPRISPVLYFNLLIFINLMFDGIFALQKFQEVTGLKKTNL